MRVSVWSDEFTADLVVVEKGSACWELPQKEGLGMRQIRTLVQRKYTDKAISEQVSCHTIKDLL